MNRFAPSSRPLAILGGTFDPVHNGHLRAAWEAAELLGAEVRLVPAHVPPHRATPVASPAQRIALLRAALEGQRNLVLDDRELRREGPSYTIDTLLELREEIGPERPLVLLLGIDAFHGLPEWHRWRELFDFAHIGVLTRPGHELQPGASLRIKIASRRCTAPQALRESPAGRVLPIAITPLEISASRIRELLAAGRQPRFLVPAALLAKPELLAPYGDARVGAAL
jgi:nicotinate-nucleotide adenylyltransferase